MKDPKFDAQDVSEVLQRAMDELIEAEELETFEEVPCSTRSYEDAGVMTRDAGFVIKVGEREFQITVVRSK